LRCRIVRRGSIKSAARFQRELEIQFEGTAVLGLTPIAFGNVLKAVAITGWDSKAKTKQAAMTRKFEPFKTTAPPHTERIG